MENWKPITGYEGIYEVSSSGVVRNIKRNGYQLSNLTVSHGYQAVALSKDGVRKLILLHRIVATAFIPNPENKPQVNHINGIKSDNRAENLEWVTADENINHAIKIGLMPWGRPTPHGCLLQKLREEKGLTIEELSKKSGVKAIHIQRFESGFSNFNMCSVDKAHHLAEALGVSIETLAGWKQTE